MSPLTLIPARSIDWRNGILSVGIIACLAIPIESSGQNTSNRESVLAPGSQEGQGAVAQADPPRLEKIASTALSVGERKLAYSCHQRNHLREDQEMQTLGKPWFWLPCMVALSAIISQTVHAQPPSPARGATSKVGQPPVANVLKRLGAKLERGCTAKKIGSYSSQFDRTDTNRDGKHTRAEYVDQGGYMTPRARAGIFRAADGNADGVVTKAEYVLNRIITDEAKVIVQGMDDNENGLVERAEFVKHATKLLADLELAEQTYAALDTNADGGIPIPEYLPVWGQWARVGRKPAEERIAARQAELGRPGTD